MNDERILAYIDEYIELIDKSNEAFVDWIETRNKRELRLSGKFDQMLKQISQKALEEYAQRSPKNS